MLTTHIPKFIRVLKWDNPDLSGFEWNTLKMSEPVTFAGRPHHKPAIYRTIIQQRQRFEKIFQLSLCPIP